MSTVPVDGCKRNYHQNQREYFKYLYINMELGPVQTVSHRKIYTPPDSYAKYCLYFIR